MQSNQAGCHQFLRFQPLNQRKYLQLIILFFKTFYLKCENPIENWLEIHRNMHNNLPTLQLTDELDELPVSDELEPTKPMSTRDELEPSEPVCWAITH